jgi:hypothetical protein
MQAYTCCSARSILSGWMALSTNIIVHTSTLPSELAGHTRAHNSCPSPPSPPRNTVVHHL